MSFKDKDDERRDLFAHVSLASHGYHLEAVPEKRGQTNIDLIVEGKYWEVKSPDADGTTSKDPLKFVQNNIESAYDQFKGHPEADKSETRIIFNCRYTPIDAADITKRVEVEMRKRRDIKEVLLVTKSGDVIHLRNQESPATL